MATKVHKHTVNTCLYLVASLGC